MGEGALELVFGRVRGEPELEEGSEVVGNDEEGECWSCRSAGAECLPTKKERQRIPILNSREKQTLKRWTLHSPLSSLFTKQRADTNRQLLLFGAQLRQR